MRFDYIIAGSGCAGLSLAMHIVESGKLSDKRILIVDKEKKDRNDRTWCFWEKGSGMFEEIVSRKWDKVWFYSDDYSRELKLSPFRYKMIRGLDFYEYCIGFLSKHPAVHFITAEIEEMNSEEGSITVNGNKLYAQYIFNSIPPKINLEKKEFQLLQHFKGWVVKTNRPVFDATAATLMDFRVAQNAGTTFAYVLPFSETSALIEYTIFSEALLSETEYIDRLRSYISDILKIEDFEIEEEEFGVIPMTNHKFKSIEGKVVNIGSAGGLTKPSSGYTFYFIQKHSEAIVNSLSNKLELSEMSPLARRRFSYFDSVLLNVLATHKVQGKAIFTDLFKSNSPQQILKFLNNESSILTDLKIISSLPTLPFLKAGIEQL